MKKAICVQVLLIIYSHFLFAQDFTVEESEGFIEPENGWLKIFQLENSKTVLLHLTYEGGLNYKLYDGARTLELEKVATPQFGNKGKLIRGASFETAFVMDNNIVLFVTNLVNKIPILYRVILDKNTGTIVQEDELFRAEKYKPNGTAPISIGGEPGYWYFIRKDPNSSNYGIAVNYLNEDKNKTLELVHYGSSHKETNRRFYVSTTYPLGMVQIFDLLVLGENKIIVLLNTFKEFGKSSVYLASLEKGATPVQVKEVTFVKDKQHYGGVIKHNSKQKTLNIMVVAVDAFEKKATYISSFLSSVDPNSLSTIAVHQIKLPNLNKKVKEQFEEKEDYAGVPQNFHIDAEGNYVVVFEERKSISGGKYNDISNIFGNIGIAILDQKFQEIDNYIIPKSHAFVGPIHPFHTAFREFVPEPLYNSNQYKGIFFVNGKDKKYLLFNDAMKNMNLIKTGNIATV